MARNIVTALVFLTVDDEEAAADCILHVWYSARLQQGHLTILNKHVLPRIEYVVAKTKGKSATTLLAKTWEFGARSVRVILTKQHWDLLPSYFKVPAGMSTVTAQQIRHAVTMNEEHQDCMHQTWLRYSPARRLCAFKFRKDGVLLPFGAACEDFSIPNPFVHPALGLTTRLTNM